jgi:hypothetical protein
VQHCLDTTSVWQPGQLSHEERLSHGTRRCAAWLLHNVVKQQVLFFMDTMDSSSIRCNWVAAVQVQLSAITGVCCMPQFMHAR